MMKWYNEPPAWNIDGDTIKITSNQNTDFWRKTEYDFISDNGHFYYKTVKGDFCSEVNICGQYKEQYDQAGLMVRLDESHWLKCGIELIDGIQHVIAVITHDYSDVSIFPIPPNLPSIWIRVLRRKAVLEVLYSFDGEKYTRFRMAHFTSNDTVSVGIISASPTKGSFSTTFTGFKIESCII